MAKPRVFVSSTYFDLRVIRADIERFLKEIGHEPVLFERGHVPYGKEEALEEYCYRELNSCDILVAIIGGKFGTESKEKKNSISQQELKTAYTLGKQVYIFVETAVHSEFKTYQRNKTVTGFTPVSVDDCRVFEFLEEVYALPSGNPIEPFATSEDIVRFLREQFAGLFQRLLQESARQKEIRIIEDLSETAETLKQLVTFLTEARTKGDAAIHEILLHSHPAFSAIRRTMSIPYRVVFRNLAELKALVGARGYVFDNLTAVLGGDYDFDNKRSGIGVRVSQSIFDDLENLKILTPEEWNDEWISSYELEKEEDRAEAPAQL